MDSSCSSEEASSNELNEILFGSSTLVSISISLLPEAATHVKRIILEVDNSSEEESRAFKEISFSALGRRSEEESNFAEISIAKALAHLSRTDNDHHRLTTGMCCDVLVAAINDEDRLGGSKEVVKRITRSLDLKYFISTGIVKNDRELALKHFALLSLIERYHDEESFNEQLTETLLEILNGIVDSSTGVTPYGLRSLLHLLGGIAAESHTDEADCC